MKRLFLSALLLVALLVMAPEAIAQEHWKRVWKEDFHTGVLNKKVWKRTTRGTPDWQNTQSDDPRCLDMREGCLILRGIVNDNLEKDTAQYLTGGVVTEGLKAFVPPCRIEIRARLHAAQGAWPALWLMPYDTANNHWPHGGEIDIMERLNGDSIAYQTVHSKWTYIDHHGDDPKQGGKGQIDPDDFNVYGVDILADSVVFHINGKHTLTYPRVKGADAHGQFPFLRPMYLLMDMQLGGDWVGRVNPNDLPVEMEIDWVKYYRKK